MMMNDKLIILIAPNVSDHMGGEAVKAKQIFKSYKRYHLNTLLITHERNHLEILNWNSSSNIYIIKDDWLFCLIWKTTKWNSLINLIFLKKAVELAQTLPEKINFIGSSVIIHQIGPNSPVLPRYISNKHINVFGPINGNVYFPMSFKHYESIPEKIRRYFHYPLQKNITRFFKGLVQADMIFFAGGSRTLNSLIKAGCDPKKLQATIDCGVNDELLDRMRIIHHSFNRKFIHAGRLIKFKGTDLVIKSLSKTKNEICLDIIGDGPESAKCRRLTRNLGLEHRVKFIRWKSQIEIFNMFHQYRGLVLPSLGDSNGIVIQEAMAMGLPPICLDWGGPQLLIDHEINGFLINPTSEDEVVCKIAEYLDLLAEDYLLAEEMSIAARIKANEWRWSKVVQEWLNYY